MFGVVIPLNIWVNPVVIQVTPGDLAWHQVPNYPPSESNKVGFGITTVAPGSPPGSGTGCWMQWNTKTAPSGTGGAWPLHGGGQIQIFGGGQNQLWVQAWVSTDIIIVICEGV